jgi:DNA-binding MarR family transcriptional regulator
MKGKERTTPAEQAVYQLHLCLRLLHVSGSRIARGAGLRPPQVAFLGFLHEAGPLNMSTISRLTNVTVSVATRFIERLERKGLVERVQDDRDRRVVLVRPTGEGDRLAEEMLEAYNHSLGEALEGIAGRDFEVFLSVLAQINEKLASRFPHEHLSEIMSAHPDETKEGHDED